MGDPIDSESLGIPYIGYDVGVISFDAIERGQIIDAVDNGKK